MRLRVFFANDGDCLLLSSSDGRNVLIDGGHYANTFREHTLPHLKELRQVGQQLDLVIVSHIDADHIVGILTLMQYYAQSADGVLRSSDPQLPSISALWHNAWHQQVGGELAARIDSIGDQRTATAYGIAAYARGPDQRTMLADLRGVRSFFAQTWGVDQGEQLVQIIDSELSAIRRNEGFDGDLVQLATPLRPRIIGDVLRLHVLGPSESSLADLKAFWQKELDDDDRAERRAAQPEEQVEFLAEGPEIIADYRVRRFRAAGSGMTGLRRGATVMAAFERPAGKLGDESEVTIPNRASIIVLAEEARRRAGTATCLLTGDATTNNIFEGLGTAEKFDSNGIFRCDAVKMQHHGGEFNFREEFAQKVIARHYVFCANGLHHNPDTRVVDVLIAGRAGADSTTPFTVWFDCTPHRASPSYRDAMEDALHTAVAAAQQVNSQHAGLVTVRVLNGNQPFFDICLCQRRAECRCLAPDEATTVLN